MLATVIGTLSHEGGHYVVSKCFGYHPRIHYASCSFGDSEVVDSLAPFYEKYEKQLEEDLPFPGKEKYEELVQRSSWNELWILFGGPLQTMLTGTIGFILLMAWRNSFKEKKQLSFRQWSIVFLTLFWLRQTANLVVWLGVYLLTNKFSERSDEVRIAIELGWPFWLLTLITGVVGLVILYVVVFKFIPRQQRLTFILAGIVGGVAGYILWLHLLGPVLLP